MPRFGLVSLALSLCLSLSLAALCAGCGGGIEPGMATDVDKKPLDPGPPDVQPNMSGPSTAPAPKK
jgi:hypothetical protein